MLTSLWDVACAGAGGFDWGRETWGREIWGRGGLGTWVRDGGGSEGEAERGRWREVIQLWGGRGAKCMVNKGTD
jgi:hypothetical protein